jgi:hypothetical protein
VLLSMQSGASRPKRYSDSPAASRASALSGNVCIHDDPAIAQRAHVERRNADVEAAMSTTTNL